MFRYPTPTRSADSGYAIAGDRFAILVAADVAEGVVARLWNAAAAETAVLEDVLSVLVAAGMHDLPDFAIAEFPDGPADPVRVAVRGGAIVETSARTRLAGPDARTWVETAVPNATGIRLALTSADAGGDLLPLGLGVTRADEMSWGRPFPAGRADEPVQHEPVVVPPVATVTAAAAARFDESDVLQTISIDRSLFARPLDEEEELPAFLTEDAPIAAPIADDPLDERTLLGSRRAAPAPPAPIGYELGLPGGRAVPLDRPVVLGRGPRPGQHPGARIERVASPGKEVSGTHLEATLDGDTLVVRDLDSTNGTIVRPPSSAAALLRGGAVSRVPVGTELDLGDGVTAVFRPRE